MKTKEEFSNVKAIVEELLREDDRCRNDDKWLTYKVMRRYTNIYIPFSDFKKIPAFETIKRCRAKIQNQEKRLLPTDPSVILKRNKRMKDISEWAMRF